MMMLATQRTGVRAERKNERRAEIVETAFQQIAVLGLEGLRVRDVADAVGINNATLHYYFPSKEDLIAAVVDRLAEHMATLLSVRDDASPEERLHAHLARLNAALIADPAPFRVSVELAARGYRDATIRQALLANRQRWHEALVSLLREIDATSQAAEVHAELMMATLQGIMLDPHCDRERARLVIDELERLILGASDCP